MRPLPLLKRTVVAWWGDNGPQRSAALAFYTLFSLAPLLVVLLGVTGLFFDRTQLEGRLMEQVDLLIGRQGADAVRTILHSMQESQTGQVASLSGIILLIFGASGVLVELQSGFHQIWKIPYKSIVELTIRQRLFSLVILVGLIFLLLVSLGVSTAISALGQYLFANVPYENAFWRLIDFFVSWLAISCLFAFIFKVLPHRTLLSGRSIFLGATLTAALFSIGKTLVGLYIGKASIISAYGAAGSLAVILIWVYYSALILYLGAEFIKVLSESHRAARA